MAIEILKGNGYFVLSPEEMESMHSMQKEEMEPHVSERVMNEQRTSID
jgi:hypothetical protein